MKFLQKIRETNKMNKNDIIALINEQKGIEVLIKKNTYFSNIVKYGNKNGWWFNIPFSKFYNNLYMILNNADSFILIEILANTIVDPKSIFRNKDENKSDIFIPKNDNDIFIDEQSGGSNYVFNTQHKIIKSNCIQEDLEVNLSEYSEYLNHATEKSKGSSQKARQERLKSSSKYPETIKITTTQFKRNPDVIVEVLKRANGICEKCNQKAPFIRKKDKTPYLEVHHKVRLIDGGEDSIDNAIAVCPNCHRELHYG